MARKKTQTEERAPTAVLTRGFDPSLSVGSARPAVFRSSTYVFSTPESAARAFEIALGKARPAPGENVDLIYSRLSHPNAEILEAQIAPLEIGASAAAAFNSGMAALATLFFTFTRPGDRIIYTAPVYGGTAHLFHTVLAPLNIESIAVSAGDARLLDDTIRATKNLRVVFVETPANPTLRMTSLERAVKAARKHPNRPLVVVDNTFLGPTFQHPFTHGVDLVVYSATKYLAGFSDMLAGVVLAKNPEHIASLKGMRGVLGTILQPDECWLLASRLPTVTLRMNRQSKNAQRIAEGLVKHPRLRQVIYPSFFTDREQIRIRDAQCDFPGAVLSLELEGGRAAAFTFLRSVRLFHNAVSLGGVESLACHPRTTTHSELTAEELDAAGITEGLVRLSVGVEDWRDLLADVQKALT